MSMTGTEWADCIGLTAAQSPLREGLAALGAEPAEVVDRLDDAGIELQFKEGRLYHVQIWPTSFAGPLPGNLPESGPLGSEFESSTIAPGVVEFQRTIDGLTVSVMDEQGIRFSVAVTALGDLDALPPRPMSTLWTATGPRHTEPPPPQSGIPFGYKTSWFAIRHDDPAEVQSALQLSGAPQPCDPRTLPTMPFISAARDGWCVVVNAPIDDPEEGFIAARRASQSLDSAACFFWSDRVIGSFAWSPSAVSRAVNGGPKMAPSGAMSARPCLMSQLRSMRMRCWSSPIASRSEGCPQNPESL